MIEHPIWSMQHDPLAGCGQFALMQSVLSPR